MMTEAVTEQTFHKIRQVTTGMLNAKVYRAIYDAALDVTRGVYVDIGPAQGGSTIAIALARQSAGRHEQIYTADVFTASNALKHSDVDANVGVLRGNLAEFGLGAGIKVIVVGREDIATAIPEDVEIGLFFVDADGAIDRDFEQFYDRIVPGGIVILDDYQDKINSKYVEFPADRLDRYVKSKGAEKASELTPLGKHYSVYRFTNELVDLGLIEEIQTLNNTIFLRRIGTKPYAESGAPEGLANVREAIAKEFFDAREAFSASVG